jgi:hypothetical protein
LKERLDFSIKLEISGHYIWNCASYVTPKQAYCYAAAEKQE